MDVHPARAQCSEEAVVLILLHQEYQSPAIWLK
jgi:hypothetical protein